jgi:hypothetical protein
MTVWPLNLITTWVAENVAVQPSSQSCPMARSDPEARSGMMWAVHASTEMEGNWSLAVWLDYMMPPLGTKTEMLGLVRRLFVYM